MHLASSVIPQTDEPAHFLHQMAYDGHWLRVAMRDHEPWWFAKEICDTLNLHDVEQLIGTVNGKLTQPFLAGDALSHEPIISLQAVKALAEFKEAADFGAWLSSVALPRIAMFEESIQVSADMRVVAREQGEQAKTQDMEQDFGAVLARGHEGGKGEFPVDARQLHEKLGIGRRFSDWMKDQLKPEVFFEGRDFVIEKSEAAPTAAGGRKSIEYHLALRTAQHLAMMQNTKVGYALRNYLLDIEERYQNLQKAALEREHSQRIKAQKRASALEPVASIGWNVQNSLTLTATAQHLGLKVSELKKFFGVNGPFPFIRHNGREGQHRLTQEGIQTGWFVEIRSLPRKVKGEMTELVEIRVTTQGLQALREMHVFERVLEMEREAIARRSYRYELHFQ